ncbi:MAG: hypothetical protein CBE00_05995 [Planctomycetaceae bacterium TMED240]|nr:MAG: hypothetical protein CBE00_05995 [Planctomycetaceae bacterium TMED240]
MPRTRRENVRELIDVVPVFPRCVDHSGARSCTAAEIELEMVFRALVRAASILTGLMMQTLRGVAGFGSVAGFNRSAHAPSCRNDT